MADTGDVAPAPGAGAAAVTAAAASSTAGVDARGDAELDSGDDSDRSDASDEAPVPAAVPPVDESRVPSHLRGIAAITDYYPAPAGVRPAPPRALRVHGEHTNAPWAGYRILSKLAVSSRYAGSGLMRTHVSRRRVGVSGRRVGIQCTPPSPR